MALTLSLQCGATVRMPLPEPPADDAPTVFVLGVRKSGSTLFNRLASTMARRYQRPALDVGGGFFAQDLKFADWAEDPAVAQVFQPGVIYLGFRAPYARFRELPVYPQARKLLLVRDPRDALVSEYFSTLRTHSVPVAARQAAGAAEQVLARRELARQQSVDDYVLLNARSFKRTLESYLPLLDDLGLSLFRYEEVVGDKGPWIRSLLQQMALPEHEPFIERLLRENDLQPPVEDPGHFVRRVTPGDHAEKLRPPTIEALNLIFADVMRPFGYRLR
jgi:hypothetical protein